MPTRTAAIVAFRRVARPSARAARRAPRPLVGGSASVIVGAGERPATIARRMKLIIQIPCLNEEEQLPGTLADLPRVVAGFDAVEWLIIDDGSTDRTIDVARAHGVDHVVRLTNNKGLAAAFQAGIDASLKLGADVIVNTDADNQYDARDIPKLIDPILRGDADLVVGDRVIDSIEHFSPLKKRLQHFGSAVVRRASGTDVQDNQPPLPLSPTTGG